MTVRPGSRPTTDRGPQGCKACRWSGQREVAWHRSAGDGRVLVDVFAAACDCPLGGSLGLAFARVGEFVERLRSDAKTLAVYHTDVGHPHLDREERFAPDVVEAIYRRANATGRTT